MLYTAKCFWPGATEADIRFAAANACDAFRGVLYLPGDELALCLFNTSSSAAAKRASEQAGMPCERIIESVWVAPPGEGGTT
jgi:hypothetical protein